MSWQQYAAERSGMKYYRVVKEFIQEYSPGESILDVGCGGTDTIYTGEFDLRTVVNLDPVPEYPGVETVIGKFPEVQLPRDRFSVVTCLQVLEHLTDDAMQPFVERLFSLASHVVIVSVPFQWPRGACSHHVQDPIDCAKLQRMLGRPWNKSSIVTDHGMKRLVVSTEIRSE